MVVGSMTVDADVAVIGAGPGGYVAAIRAAQLGKDVYLIDERKELGGVCLNVGCIPTKALIHASNFFGVLKDLESVGIEIENHKVNLDKMRKWKEGILSKLSSGVDMLCKKNGIEVINGRADFCGPNEIHIGGQSDITKIRFKNCIIATGSVPIEIPGFSFENPKIGTSDDALALKSIPPKVVIIGGGYIGTEMGTVYGKLGSEVHIVEMMDRLIATLDKEIVDVAAKKIQQFNVHPHLRSKALGVEEKDGKLFVKIEEDGKPAELEADQVFVVVGRKPNTQGLNLETVGVKTDDHGFIKVDNTMKTSNECIYAIGDVVGQPMLAHKASREAHVAAECIAGKKSAFDNKVIPFVVFNDPEISSVGLTESEAKEKEKNVVIGKFPFAALGRAQTLNQTDGFVKWVSDKETGVILGMQCVGPGASDIISEAALAIELGATMEDIALTIHPHPTLPESLMEAAEVALGQGIHIFTPKK